MTHQCVPMLVLLLLQLEAFLTQRLQDVRGDDLLTSSLLQAAPASLHVTEDALSAMLSDAQGVLEQLTSQRMRELILIRSSPR